MRNCLERGQASETTLDNRIGSHSDYATYMVDGVGPMILTLVPGFEGSGFKPGQGVAAAIGAE